MKRSINEIEALAFKAARGADVPLGHAEDFARAVGMLAMTQPDKLDCVTDALRSEEVVAVPLAIDALRCGAERVPLSGSPLIAGYLDRATLDFGVLIQWDGANISLGGNVPRPTKGPVAVPDQVWAALEAFAQKTYVPATAASRAGAGAGAIDND